MGKLSEQEDAWLRQATTAAIAAARKVVLGDEAAINKNAPVGRLSDTEWGWIVCAAIFAWIRTRAEQATLEELDTERLIRMTGLDPCPWDQGAIIAVLPKIGGLDVDWNKPLADWSREQMVAFLQGTLNVVRAGLTARDLGGRTTTRKHGDLNDEVPTL